MGVTPRPLVRHLRWAVRKPSLAWTLSAARQSLRLVQADNVRVSLNFPFLYCRGIALNDILRDMMGKCSEEHVLLFA